MLIYTLCVLAIIGFSVFYLFFYRGRRRERQLTEPFPKYWQQAMTQAYDQLRDSLRHRKKPWLDPLSIGLH